MQVEEFCKSVYASHLNHPKGVYLIWKWDWISLPPRRAESSSSLEVDDMNSASAYDGTTEEDDDEPSLYTVRFKCMGANGDGNHQRTLEKVNDLLQAGNKVKVNLILEPTNPMDAKAIAFKCLLDDDQWHRIGYVVREALDDVHSALKSNQITDIQFGWVKFRFDFKASGGVYAAIDITRKGSWSPVVCRASSR